MKLVLAVIGALWLCGVAAAAHGEDAPVAAERTVGGDQAFAVALQLFIRNAEYDKALGLLESRPDVLATPAGFRLRVQLLMELRRDDEALKALEAHLSQVPDDAEARFQLGEIHYRHRRDQASALAFRLALAGHLEPFRVQISQARLQALSLRRPWHVWAGASLAPDSNLNSATDVTQVELFGLPFALDPSARRHSGVNLNLFGGVESTWHLSPKVALRSTLSGEWTDGPGTLGDYGSLSVLSGPEWRVGPVSVVSLRPGYAVTWYGGRVLERRAGLNLEGDVYADNRRWTGGVSVNDIQSPFSPDRVGTSYALSLSRTRYFESSSLWRASSAVVVRRARAASEGYRQVQASVGRLFQGPAATFLYVEGTLLDRRYDGVAAAFGVRRQDREADVQVRLSKQDWLIGGGHPFASLLLSSNTSTLDLYTYNRQRLEFGFTREF